MAVVSKGHRVFSQVFETSFYSGNNLFLSDLLFSSLASVYPLVGKEEPEEKMDVKVWLVNNTNPIRRMVEYTFEAEKSGIAREINLDPLCGYSEKSVSLASSNAMRRYDLTEGELIAIHAVPPEARYLGEL
ncbi:MAG: hypothetical protein ABIA12_00745 [Candidatus Aenigmatarchaeota archaeon]